MNSAVSSSFLLLPHPPTLVNDSTIVYFFNAVAIVQDTAQDVKSLVIGGHQTAAYLPLVQAVNEALNTIVAAHSICSLLYSQK